MSHNMSYGRILFHSKLSIRVILFDNFPYPERGCCPRVYSFPHNFGFCYKHTSLVKSRTSNARPLVFYPLKVGMDFRESDYDVMALLEHLQDPDPAHRDAFVDSLPTTTEEELSLSGHQGEYFRTCGEIVLEPNVWLTDHIPL